VQLHLQGNEGKEGIARLLSRQDLHGTGSSPEFLAEDCFGHLGVAKRGEAFWASTNSIPAGLEMIPVASVPKERTAWMSASQSAATFRKPQRTRSMRDKVFLDTNIFVYAIDASRETTLKRDIARGLIREHMENQSDVIRKHFIEGHPSENKSMWLFLEVVIPPEWRSRSDSAFSDTIRGSPGITEG
jgi:hypothetical protein